MKFLFSTLFLFFSLAAISQDKAYLQFGEFKQGETIDFSKIEAFTHVHLVNADGTINSDYRIVDGNVWVQNEAGNGKIKRGGELDDKALKLLKKSSGKQITLQVTYFTPDNERIKGGVSYQVSE